MARGLVADKRPCFGGCQPLPATLFCAVRGHTATSPKIKNNGGDPNGKGPNRTCDFRSCRPILEFLWLSTLERLLIFISRKTLAGHENKLCSYNQKMLHFVMLCRFFFFFFFLILRKGHVVFKMFVSLAARTQKWRRW